MTRNARRTPQQFVEFAVVLMRRLLSAHRAPSDPEASSHAHADAAMNDAVTCVHANVGLIRHSNDSPSYAPLTQLLDAAQAGMALNDAMEDACIVLAKTFMELVGNEEDKPQAILGKILSHCQMDGDHGVPLDHAPRPYSRPAKAVAKADAVKADAAKADAAKADASKADASKAVAAAQEERANRLAGELVASEAVEKQKAKAKQAKVRCHQRVRCHHGD